MNRYNETRKLAAPVFQATRLLDQVRERIRYIHYSLQTEKAYLYWARFFIRWHGRTGIMRHPRDMGLPEVEAFLTMLANERQVSPATHRQALNALLFCTNRCSSRTWRGCSRLAVRQSANAFPWC